MSLSLSLYLSLSLSLKNNVKTLRDNGIRSLFHFTDASNLDSIRANGLLTWKTLNERKISCKMNSSDLSHKLDASKGLADFVRLSFCKRHPMLYKAKAEKRISTPVVLEIKLEVVSRPGVLFCETNAAANGSKASESPRVIRFEVVKATSSRAVPESQRPFYQGEVLVPDNIPPHLIKIPNVDAFSRPLEHSGRLPDPNLVMGTLRSETEAKASKPSSIANQHLTIAAGAGSSTPKPRVSPIEVFIAGDGKSNQETFTASEPVHSAVEVKSDCTDKPAHSALLSAPTSPSASLVFTASATGGVVAVRADGDCCYHLCGVFMRLNAQP